MAGVEPNKDYPTLYRYFVEVWIYLGLAWLSLFFNWKVRMVIEAHKALKKRRKLRKLSLDELRSHKASHKASMPRAPFTSADVNIFSFMSKKQEGYNDLIKRIGPKKEVQSSSGNGAVRIKEPSRSQSCTDPVHSPILSLDRSPRHKRRYSFSDRVTVAFSKSKNYLLGSANGLLLTEDHSDELDQDLDQDQQQMYENQLDKEADLEKAVGDCGPWDSKDLNPLSFQNANITFIDEENFLSSNLEEEDEGEREDEKEEEEDDNCDDDSKAKLSINTCDENIETNFKEEQSSMSDGSVFTCDGSEDCQSYEKLVEEYAKEDNTES